MKKTFVIILITAGFIACQNADENKLDTKYFGKYGDTTLVEDGAISAKEMLLQLEGKDSLVTKFEAKINTCCQKKGCWMSVDLGDGKEMRVKFYDYGFFVPFNSADHMAIMQGTAYIDTVSVQELKHLAKDEEKSQAEIDAITSPEIEYTFMATGVIIK